MAHTASEDVRAQLRATIVEAAAGMVLGSVVNHREEDGKATGHGSGGGAVSSYIPSSTRLQALLGSTQQLKQLLTELEAAEVGNEALTKLQRTQVPVPTSFSSPTSTNYAKGTSSATTASLLAVRAWNSQKKFAALCELALKPPSTSTSAPAAAAFLAFSDSNESSDSGEERGTSQREAAVKPLAQVRTAFQELTHCAGYTYQDDVERLAREGDAAVVAARAEGESVSLPSSPHTMRHLPLLVERMRSTVQEVKDSWLAPASSPAGVAAGRTEAVAEKRGAKHAMPSLVSAEEATKLFATLGAWPQPLLRLLNEALQSPTLEAVTEATKEQLRRATFDVDELAHEQEQAVTDGDMRRSENLYFQQTELLESMNPLFDKLEAVMARYQAEQVDKPRERLRALQKQFTSSYQEALHREEGGQRKAQEDLRKLAAWSTRLRETRTRQQAGWSLYKNEWQRLFDGNTLQQEDCLKAMAQLEVRLRELAQERAFLVQDRMEKLEEERHRSEAAAAFQYFADAHGAALAKTAQELAVLVDSVKQMGAAVEFGCAHTDAYLRDVLQTHVQDELLAARKQRLAQFRSLYLTLGDLQFKKSRHADEIAKKVEYYSIQQEVAMDALNPKAKEYSVARQKWAMVQDEVDAQVQALQQRTQQQLEAFQPTERLLLESGVTFTHPVEELQHRNAAREQKLIEYKQLMENRLQGSGGAGEASPASPSPSGSPAVERLRPTTGSGSGAGADAAVVSHDAHTAADILAKDMRMLARHAPRLQSTEEDHGGNGSGGKGKSSRKTGGDGHGGGGGSAAVLSSLAHATKSSRGK